MKRLLVTLLIFATLAPSVTHAALTDSIISYWSMDEASGTRADSTATGNDLTDNNTVGSATGIINNAADFENTNSEYFTHADNASLSPTGDLSFSWWYRPESQDSTAFTSKWDGQGTLDVSWQVRYTPSSPTEKIRFAISPNCNATGLVEVTWNITLSNATDYHMVFSYDASAGTVDLWINDSAQTQKTGLPTSIADCAVDFRIGTTEGGSGLDSYLDGLLDEFGMWSRTLTSAEVTELYNSGAGLAYPFTGGGGAVQPPQLNLGFGFSLF